MAKRADARYVISADDRTRQGTMSAEQNFRGLQKSVFSFGSAATIAGAAAVTALTGITRAAFDSIDRLDALAKAGREIDVSPETAAALGTAGERSGAGAEKMIKAFQKVNKEAAKAQAGLAEPIRYFEQIGLGKDAAAELSNMERFVLVLDRINKLRDQGVNVEDLQSQLLGRQSGKITAGGSGQIIEALEFQLKFGAALDDSARKAEEAADAYEDMATVVSQWWDTSMSKTFQAFQTAMEATTVTIGAINRRERDERAGVDIAGELRSSGSRMER